MKITSTYLHLLFDPLHMKRVVSLAKKIDIPYDGWVATGSSGMGIVNVLALATKKPWMFIRKEEGSHSEHLKEGAINLSRYMFVDDMIFSGSTLKRVQKEVNVVGTVLYAQGNPQSRIKEATDVLDKSDLEKGWILTFDFVFEQSQGPAVKAEFKQTITWNKNDKRHLRPSTRSSD